MARTSIRAPAATACRRDARRGPGGLRVDDVHVGFDDALQGRIEQQLARDVGDFVLLRADGYFAYQLAVVADDADQGITHVVRGADLLDSTARQIFLQRCLGVPTPAYAHLPVVVNAQGEKLSKQTLAPPIDAVAPAPTLCAALRFLGQSPPAELARAAVAEVWDWALAHWDMARVPRRRDRCPICCNRAGRSRRCPWSDAPGRRPASGRCVSAGRLAPILVADLARAVSHGPLQAGAQLRRRSGRRRR